MISIVEYGVWGRVVIDFALSLKRKNIQASHSYKFKDKYKRIVLQFSCVLHKAPFKIYVNEFLNNLVILNSSLNLHNNIQL